MKGRIMKHPMVTLFFTALSWMFLRGARSWAAPDFCRGYECPQYTLVEENKPTKQHFEERVYEASRWITTDVVSVETEDVKAGFVRLYDYCTGKNEESASVTTKTWPALITLTELEDGGENASVSFFIPPDTDVLPKPTDLSIREETMSGGSVYVRVFSETPSHSHMQANMQRLRADLEEAGKAFEPLRYIGAGYQNPWDIFHHHNEVWVHAAMQVNNVTPSP